MSLRLTFLVDDNQWRDTLVGAIHKRSLEVGDYVEVQLEFPFPKALDWLPIRSQNPVPKKLVQLETELSYFSGEVVDSINVPYGPRQDEFTDKVFREFLIDCGLPIVTSGAFRNEDPVPVTGGSYECLTHVWGTIGFHYGHLLKPVKGKIASIAQFTPVPSLKGRIILRRMTINITNHGNVVNRLELIDPSRAKSGVC